MKTPDKGLWKESPKAEKLSPFMEKYLGLISFTVQHQINEMKQQVENIKVRARVNKRNLRLDTNYYKSGNMNKFERL